LQETEPTPEPAPPPTAEDGSALADLFALDAFEERLRAAGDWLSAQMLTVDTALQGVILLAALAPAALFGPQLKKLFTRDMAARLPAGPARRAAGALAVIATPIALYLILQLAAFALRLLERPSAILEGAVSLLTAWIVIRLVTLTIRSPLWSKVAFYIAWPIAALDAFGVLDDALAQLDAFAIPIGKDASGAPINYSAFDFLRTLFVFGALFWIASLVNRFVKNRLAAVEELTTAFKALLFKILDVLTPVAALLIALQVVGFPFATLAVFGGAVGLGIGLGLQRTVSNFFAGFTLIADKSIKPGDVIEIGNTFGWVTEMTARYVSVRTRDGTEHLVPNDTFLQNGVVNWSHSDRAVRLHAAFSVAYSTKDLRAVKALAEETARSTERVLAAPAPVCNLTAFGDSAIEFDLRFWINDPASGISNVKSAVMLNLWDALRARGVEIPYPHLDVSLKTAPALKEALKARRLAALQKRGFSSMIPAGTGPRTGPIGDGFSGGFHDPHTRHRSPRRGRARRLRHLDALSAGRKGRLRLFRTAHRGRQIPHHLPRQFLDLARDGRERAPLPRRGADAAERL
jgi:small-conductance mechanosensitive channel